MCIAHIDTPHFYYVKDAFKVCVSSELGEQGERGECGEHGLPPLKSGHANF